MGDDSSSGSNTMPELQQSAARILSVATLVVVVTCLVGFTHKDTVLQSLSSMPISGEAAVFGLADMGSDGKSLMKANDHQLKASDARETTLVYDSRRPQTGSPVTPMNHGTAAPAKIKHAKTVNFTQPAWGYQIGYNSNGPASWADKYNTVNGKGFCDGKKQSPIDINEQRDMRVHVSNQLKFHWKMWRPTDNQYVDVINTGRTIQYQGKGLQLSTTEFEHHTYTLQNIRFYQPSEHTVNGKHYPLEMRFVHQSRDGKYLEVALLLNENKNRVAAKRWKKEPCYSCNDNFFFNHSLHWMDLPKDAGTEKRLQHGFNLLEMMPDDQNYFTYTGSFSSPPCTEGVKYVVLLPHKEINVTPRQIAAFPFHGNNRPTQPLNGRVVEYLSKVHGDYVSPLFTKDDYYGTAPPAINGRVYEEEKDQQVQENNQDKWQHKIFRDLGRIKRRHFLQFGKPGLKNYAA